MFYIFVLQKLKAQPLGVKVTWDYSIPIPTYTFWSPQLFTKLLPEEKKLTQKPCKKRHFRFQGITKYKRTEKKKVDSDIAGNSCSLWIEIENFLSLPKHFGMITQIKYSFVVVRAVHTHVTSVQSYEQDIGSRMSCVLPLRAQSYSRKHIL